jgi:hypothetical protein
MDGHELLHRPIVSLLDFFREIASRQLIALFVASYAFAASALQITVISAEAFSQVNLQVRAFSNFHQRSQPKLSFSNNYLEPTPRSARWALNPPGFKTNQVIAMATNVIASPMYAQTLCARLR